MSNQTKALLLSQSQFIYLYRINGYINYSLKKIFSVEALEFNTIEWIKNRIKSKNKKWAIYFVNKPSSNIRKQIMNLIS